MALHIRIVKGEVVTWEYRGRPATPGAAPAIRRAPIILVPRKLYLQEQLQRLLGMK